MWYVVQVKTGREEDVIKKCEERVLLPGEKVFTIQREMKRKRHGEWESCYDAVFQKYIFVESPDIVDFRIRLRNVKEMAKVLAVDGELVAIYPEEEELLKTLGGEDHIIRYSEGYVVGDTLVVTDGPLEGLEGHVKWIDRHARKVGVELKLCGREIIVKLGVGILKKLTDQEAPNGVG